VTSVDTCELSCWGFSLVSALRVIDPPEKRKLNSIICHNAPLINAGHGVSRGAIKVATTRHGIVSPRPNAPSRGVPTTTTPN